MVVVRKPVPQARCRTRVGWRRRRDHLRRYNWIHRQSKHVHPVNDVHQRIAGKLIAGNQHTTAARRRDAVPADGPAGTPSVFIPRSAETCMVLPDVTFLFNLFLAMQRQFVLHHHAGSEEPVLCNTPSFLSPI